MNNNKLNKIMDILKIKTKEGDKEIEKTYSFSFFGVLVLSFLLRGISMNYVTINKGGNKKG